ncbi:hypothetical protein [Candidatus Phytoplasma bonamiae]|uniref:Uncharacterized protein n=1 Tax=Candidatus Phytoplasma bonamiae TaxID=2982626 RepID=A0ABT9D4J0_9MOLU|nr:hypothetical protein ['Bonamia sp.' little leaf phytoplasma]MDO8064153.1 hypothetical protein ['Bonamia sp.' little leaf phytoplasma]
MRGNMPVRFGWGLTKYIIKVFYPYSSALACRFESCHPYQNFLFRDMMLMVA